MNDNTRAQLIAEVLGRTGYLSFLFRHIQTLGLKVDGSSFLYSFYPATRDSQLVIANPEQSSPPYWVELRSQDLEQAVRNKTGVATIVVKTSSPSAKLHPRVEWLVLRAFEMPPHPAGDRDDLVYPSLFGFIEPQQIWKSAKSPLKVVYYGDTGAGAYAVSSGLTSLGDFTLPRSDDESVPGTGYELVLQSNSPPLVRDFANWVRYVQDSSQNLLPGNWLEFAGGKKLPGTDVFGYVVIWSRLMPSYFMVADRTATFHELVPVNRQDLEIAKQQGVDALGYFV